MEKWTVERLGINPKLQNINKIVDKWEELYPYEQRVITGEKNLIIPDDVYAKMEETGKKFSKPIHKYNNGYKYRIMSQSQWDSILEDRRIKEIEQQECLLQLQKEQEQAQELGLISREEINNKIKGVYWTETVDDQFFWTMIGDKYSINEWGTIYVDSEVYDQIISMSCPITGYKGRNWVCKSRKNSKGYSVKYKELIRKVCVQRENYGIYCIEYNGEVVYIGKTSRDFSIRFKEHDRIFRGIDDKPRNMVLYNNNVIKNLDQITYRILFNVKEAKTDGITSRDLEAMELCLITMYKPILNWQGVKGEYKFTS